MVRVSRWVPSAYLAQGIPFATVIWVAGTLLRDLGYRDENITPAIALVAVMWSLKPLYAGFLDMYGSKKSWVLAMEGVMVVLFVLAAFVVGVPTAWTAEPFSWVILVLGLIAAASATQDIAVDGVYVTSLSPTAQSYWVGWAGAAWNAGKVITSAGIVGAASWLQRTQGLDARAAWGAALLLGAGAMLGLLVYHTRYLPSGSVCEPPSGAREILATLRQQWVEFVARPRIVGLLAFIALYRCGEGLLLMEVPLFMQGNTQAGGLGLCATSQVTTDCPHLLSDMALIDGLLTTGVGALFGILGGRFLASVGLNRKTMLFMACCLNVPHVTLIVLSQWAHSSHVVSLSAIATLVMIERAGYSFGFVANMAYMMQQVATGRYATTHYAFCTALMHLLLIPIQAVSGPLATLLGYRAYFLFAFIAAAPSLWVAWRAPFAASSSPAPLNAGSA